MGKPRRGQDGLKQEMWAALSVLGRSGDGDACSVTESRAGLLGGSPTQSSGGVPGLAGSGRMHAPPLPSWYARLLKSRPYFCILHLVAVWQVLLGWCLSASVRKIIER